MDLLQYLQTVTGVRGAGRLKEHNYVCMEDFVADRGVPFASTPLTAEEKNILLEAVSSAGGTARVSQTKQCFSNAQQIVLGDYTGTLLYAEGYALGAASFPVHHGWVVIGEKVIDLTWKTPKPSRGKLGMHVLGALPADWAYQGVIFSQEQIRENVLQTGYYQTLIDDWRGHWPLLQLPRLSL